MAGWLAGLKRYLKLIPVSFGFIIVVALIGLVYGFLVHGSFTLRYVFDANFFAAVILIVIGIVLYLIPLSVLTKANKLLDRSTFVQMSFENRENKQQRARLVLWLGIYNIVFAGLIQILLSLIL